ncbi:MAG: NAD(P) transhydrogenase subunit alpha [Bacteroidota bacterium]
MKIGILKESNDARVAMIPAVAAKLIKLEHELFLEAGAGEGAFYADEQYQSEGVKVVSRANLLQEMDMLVSFNPMDEAELESLKDQTIYLSLFNPRGNPDLKAHLEKSSLRPFSMDAIPRTTIAQAMDVLSSMASLAGYKAVLMAADHLPGYFPMLMTAAGTIPPAKVLILGAGVAGLQAIATARRLGATVEAFDVRAAVREEVQSLGAKFVEVEGATEDQGAGGYAVAQSEDYQRRQKQLIHERAARADVIITTANIPGRQAPLLIEQATIEAMRAGSVIVDLAAATGGNCALTENDQVVNHQGVRIIGDSNLPGKMPRDASLLFANNILNFVKYVFEQGPDQIDYQNDIVKSTYLGKPVAAVNPDA